MINDVKKYSIFLGFLFITLLSTQIFASFSWATSDSPNHSGPRSEDHAPSYESWYESIEIEWGGHLKVRGAASWPDDEFVFQPVGTGTYHDGNVEGRLKNSLFFRNWGYLETHYEAVLSGGDTRRKGKELERLFPHLLEDDLLLVRPIEDDRRFMDLTKTIDEDDDYILYHRLDRFSLTLLPNWGVVRIGRQAVTWGNGLVFNPMDLFNPFSPTDIERDYKVGDDMVFTEFSANGIEDVQFLVVPRRNPSSGEVESDQSSAAGKLHFPYGTSEFDIMMGKHYKDTVVGFGGTGYLWDAAWRFDVTWTQLDDDSRKDGYLSLVANMDYSWVWWGKNLYGFVEFYYNGLGDDNYGEAITDPDIDERIARGELFTLGRVYLSGHLRVELHPLFNLHFTIINNLEDPSGIFQPYGTWDITQNLQMTFGADIAYGGSDTEYGGFRVPGKLFLIKPSNSVFLWVSYYF